jgi:hypothetical protein
VTIISETCKSCGLFVEGPSETMPKSHVCTIWSRKPWVHDQCPGCKRVVEGTRDVVEFLEVFHKGRCALYKAWYRIEVL